MKLVVVLCVLFGLIEAFGVGILVWIMTGVPASTPNFILLLSMSVAGVLMWTGIIFSFVLGIFEEYYFDKAKLANR